MSIWLAHLRCLIGCGRNSTSVAEWLCSNLNIFIWILHSECTLKFCTKYVVKCNEKIEKNMKKYL